MDASTLPRSCGRNDSRNVVGFLHGIFKESPKVVVPRKSGYITDAAVMESHRRGGLGKRLLAAAEKWYSLHGADDIYLAAAVRNDIGLGFWTSQGFESITVSMWKPLKVAKSPAKPAVRRRRK
ncbi:MAG: GNAT family N-acetyltransferase [Candidatus Brocadiia bacterium]